MWVHWENVDIAMAVLGGALISLATVLNLYLLGRITGLSGMLFTVTRFKLTEGAIWKYSFLTGLAVVTYSVYLLVGEYFDIGGYHYYVYDSDSAGNEGLDVVGWCVGAFFVGAGTKLGNGCTTGHGVCGVPRLSLRSIAAMGFFMPVAMGTATFRHYLPFLDNAQDFGDIYYEAFRVAADAAVAGMAAGWVGLVVYSLKNREGTDKYDPLISFGTGVVFGIGLLLSGMCRRTKIIAFLTVKDGWDPSLLFVMATAVGINFPVFQYLLRKRTPLLAEKYAINTSTTIDWQVIAGSIMFGVGWGICGFCPGPGLVNLFILSHGALLVIFIIVGQMAIHHGVKLFEGRSKAQEKGKNLDNSLIVST